MEADGMNVPLTGVKGKKKKPNCYNITVHPEVCEHLRTCETLDASLRRGSITTRFKTADEAPHFHPPTHITPPLGYRV